MKIEKIPEGYLLARKGGNGCELWRKFNGAESLACDAIDELIAERDDLRAKIEAMERQEPVGKFIQHPSHGMWEQDGYGDNPDAKPLYALPGAQPAPSVPSLDMDAIERQNDELKEEVGKLRDALVLIADQYEPKCDLLIPSIARSALCATGSYGQTKAQPAPSVPEGWKLVPIEPTEKMINEGTRASTLPGPHYIDSACAKQCWVNMIAAAPKPEER